jgi:hypothetical protein
MATIDDKVLQVEAILGQKYTIDIWSQSFGDEKIGYLAQGSLLETLVNMGFNGYHVAQIVTNAGWKDKLDWVKDNYQDILKKENTFLTELMCYLLAYRLS